MHLGTSSLTNCFWTAYLDRVEAGTWRPADLVPRAIAHTAACMLARVDGKSPVEYLDRETQDIARRLAIEALKGCPQTWEQMRGLVVNQLRSQN